MSTRIGRGLLAALLLAGCGVVDSSAQVHGFDDDKETTSGKARLDVAGPDISIDQSRLQSSVRVIQGATVSQAEVDEHCAGATTNRTLIRFDVKTPNFGPGHFDVGAVQCKSTNPSPSCLNVDCYQNPSCCCDGQQACTASGSSVADSNFQYSCAHGHIHFLSFAEYRLLGTDGTIAANGHKQSFCLMDIDGATNGTSCNAASRFTCGNQGIHAGCADVYSSGLPCSFVDATGVPAGDYTLEVRVDPLDAIDESNESNNVITAQVHLEASTIDGGTPPADAGTQLFLTRKGLGSVAASNAYYASNIATPGSYTLAQWKTEHFGSNPVATGLYRNRNELGYWREMSCSRTIAAGVGGCSVTNWSDSTDPQNGVAPKGTVAMDVSPQGFTRFYVFRPDGTLTPTAILDDEGPKAVPNSCTVCHAGEYAGNGQPDLGSIWREFEPSLLQPRPGITQAMAEQEWFDLNQSIRQANVAIRSEAQGSPFGTDHAKAGMIDWLDSMYAQQSPPVSRTVGDVARMPASWHGGVNPGVTAAKQELWTTFVAPYCMSCHRTSPIDYTNYARFQEVSANLGNGFSLLNRYIHVDPADPYRHQLPFMPQSKLAFTNLNNDATALIAVDAWLSVENQRAPVAVIAGAAERTAISGDVVTLDASQSSSPDGLSIDTTWDVLVGQSVAFSLSADHRQATFTAPVVSTPTAMTIRVRARDTNLGEGAALVSFTINPVPPVVVDFTATGLPLAIPDNNATGISSSVTVTDGRRISEASVTIDLTHTYIGDLQITLFGPNGFQRVLHDHAGRDADNIHAVFPVPQAAGMNASGEWRLQVADTASIDTGTLDGWKISFAVTGTASAPTARIAALAETTVDSGATVTLDGSSSTNPSGGTLLFAWDVTTGMSLGFSPSATAPVVSFVAPQVTRLTTLVVRLTVTDGNGATSEALANLTVRPPVSNTLTKTATDVPLAIPDRNAVGVSSAIAVTENLQIASLRVTADITHTYVGDLTLTLKGPAGFEKVLRNKTGGSADDIHEGYDVPEALGKSTLGTWQLLVVDSAQTDVGSIVGFKLDFGTNGPSQSPVATITSTATTMQSGQSLTVSGSGQSPAGQSLTYLWDVVEGPPVNFSPQPTMPQVTFIAPSVMVDTQLVVRLRVTDQSSRTGETTLRLTVTPNQSLPNVVLTATGLPMSIPDNTAAGITNTITATGTQTIVGMTVTVDVTHTYRGDLKVTLLGPNGFSKVLASNSGGAADNIHESFAVPEAVGRSITGAWTLQVADTMASDVGTLDGWKITYQ